MAERFDVLVQGISKSDALHLLFAKTDSVQRPSDRYFAATRLGLCDCDETLDALIRATTDLKVDELFDRITRRKAVEALGRRKDPKAIPALVEVLRCTDTEAVINSLSALIRIGWSPNEEEESHLLNLLDGEVTQARAVIQLFTRLRIQSAQSKNRIGGLCDHESLLVSGAARAYLAQLYGEVGLMKPLVACLTDLVAGKRRSAVIDIGDSGDESLLPVLVRAPVSMSLRAKSFLQIVDGNQSLSKPENQALFEQLLRDDPLLLDIRPEWECGSDPDEIERNLSHRDEARQYGAAASLMRIDRSECLAVIESMQERLWSDYVTHYYLSCLVGLRKFSEKSDLVRSALAETTPQYTKSRIAAAWACVELQLDDQMDLLYELSSSAPWVPLRWTCQKALARLIETQQLERTF
ncbi:HEAT repeat domain-containing protein [Synechococcus sp. MIT S9508]|uniref:HEAT repeat domain-containing protein n=1 Tax=Synechococcus sp. MIT S9508 TaxID=1801629 RepID=UPI0007BB7C8C|nr:HEAT repeat domain-containing protein [Synechococcus sp. MIT S9508]KZR91102.1 PBS lyase HEAT-like repeat [Synechococcus sp. MIT S9508]